ncbi:hypothetical protein GCM10010149_21190 [Nonomuraea roseoviolacea subsp. roseoviolacea]|uniref:Uncharacterized protein n=1 Tax=Nonomuraea roseoviolacea subsp. carminata TaxID=160689 RepID=A0ABT1KCY2_9ACTN|nr:hypothetical protein [Nonomuraea roseoviolacea]MCP2351884.1 hypothetical protein [Nonomuraea roseoviolacea subsp. carminata]
MTAHPAEPTGGYWAQRDLACALTLGATGLTCVRAGVELLIDSDIWLHRPDFVEQFITTDNSVASTLAFVDWEEAITALDSGRLPCSSGERAVLRIAASMSGGIPVDLRDALTGLDPVTRALAATAVRHSAGLPTLHTEST